MIRNFISKCMTINPIVPVAALLLSITACSSGDCTKCIDNKPAATAFSTTLNAINHTITIPQAMTMINEFNAQQNTILDSAYRNTGILPISETFNLKAIDDIICQKNAIGFRIYMAMDAQRKVRFVLVGVDGDGQDVVQRTRQNQSAGAAAALPADASIIVKEAGQRWP